MTREEFDSLKSIKKLYEKGDLATASRYAYTYGIRNKDDEMIKYSNELLKKAKKEKRDEAMVDEELTDFEEI